MVTALIDDNAPAFCKKTPKLLEQGADLLRTTLTQQRDLAESVGGRYNSDGVRRVDWAVGPVVLCAWLNRCSF